MRYLFQNQTENGTSPELIIQSHAHRAVDQRMDGGIQAGGTFDSAKLIFEVFLEGAGWIPLENGTFTSPGAREFSVHANRIRARLAEAGALTDVTVGVYASTHVFDDA